MSITKDFEKKAIKNQEVGYIWKFLDVIALLHHARELESMLKKHEWSARVGQDCDHGCPECWEWEVFGKHAPDCPLAKLIEGVE